MTENSGALNMDLTPYKKHGILVGATRMAMRGIAGHPSGYVYRAYLDWLETQSGKQANNPIKSWLMQVDELHARRAPGNTCMSALSSDIAGTIENPINDSKGCGGVMRVAPIPLYFRENTYAIDGAMVSALTHGHPMSHLSSAMLVQIISLIICADSSVGESLSEIIDESCEVIGKLFPDNEYLPGFIEIIRLAMQLSQNEDNDVNNIKKLGEGWIAEEALAISLYCSLKYYDDFSAAIIAAVNHDGDSDSTGAITGNIVGAHVGYEKIPQKWKDDLELLDVILEIAEDLCYGCQMCEYSSYWDEKWAGKYGLSNSYVINRMLRGNKIP